MPVIWFLPSLSKMSFIRLLRKVTTSTINYASTSKDLSPLLNLMNFRTLCVSFDLQSRSRLRILRLKRQQQDAARRRDDTKQKNVTNVETNLVAKQTKDKINSTDSTNQNELKKLFKKSSTVPDVDIKEVIRSILKKGKSKNKIDIKSLPVSHANIILLVDFDIDIDNIITMLKKEVRILSIPTSILKSRLMMLNKHGFHVAKEIFLFQNPSILLSKLEETMDPKVKSLLKLDVRPRLTQSSVIDMIRKCPDLIQFSTAENMMSKITFLSQKLKMDSWMLGLFIYKLPSVMTFSIDALEAKATYCLWKMNIEHSELAKCPRVFSTSLQRLKTRYMFLKRCGLIENEQKIPAKSLNRIASYSDREFAEKLTGNSLKKYLDFKDQMATKLKRSASQ